MKVLLVGVGGVGEAIAIFSQPRSWCEKMVLADYNFARAQEVQARLGDADRFPVEWIDANQQIQIEALAKKHNVDLIMNACDPTFVEPIFDAAFKSGRNYMDMAVSLEKPNPDLPQDYQAGEMMGDYQFNRHQDWEQKGILALIGMGVDPGLSDVFARFAKDELFDEIEEIGVQDGGNLEVQGFPFAPTFSIWTTIDECLNPPVIWEKNKGWFTTEPFSEPEIFEFPDGIGPIECVNVDHEEVVLIPRQIPCQRVTFKYGLGREFISTLKTLHMLGLDREDLVQVKDVKVAPRDVLVACLLDPAYLGERMSGKTSAGTWVKGTKDGKPHQVYLYQVADNETCMREFGAQAVVAQTGVFPVITMDLLANGVWQGKGVLGPEAFPPKPFMEKMVAYGFPYGIKEM
jgi:saccharopine dehydrogenase-like NADP-dependent oxidoreductase